MVTLVNDLSWSDGIFLLILRYADTFTDLLHDPTRRLNKKTVTMFGLFGALGW